MPQISAQPGAEASATAGASARRARATRERSVEAARTPTICAASSLWQPEHVDEEERLAVLGIQRLEARD